MFSAAVFLALICAANALFDPDFFRSINDKQKLWKSGPNFITDRGTEYAKRLMGAKVNKTVQLPVRPNARQGDYYVPDYFDAREQWADCNTISSIKDQSYCGSSWAVATASAFSDRLCIATKGKFNRNMSVENLLTCCPYCGSGCGGGYIDIAWNYIETDGLVSGGDYSTHDGCQPYEIPPSSEILHQHKRHEDSTPKCHFQCSNHEYETSYTEDIKKVTNAYVVGGYHSDLQIDILKYGPVSATMRVYEDFLSYQSGVYAHITGDFIGYHAVRIIGWGEHYGYDYWLAANSWSTQWGEHGFFKIRRGVSECDIAKLTVAGIPEVK